jgi:Saxitoxin biosynthesis operon protein SxtJ
MRDSNRSFGMLIGGVLLLVAGVHYWKERPDFFVWLIVASAFIAVALLMPRTLAPLRRLWLKLGHLLSLVVSPIILALMYVLAIVVTGVLIRLFGKDLLSLKLKPGDASYWIKRNPPGPELKSLADQF